MLYDMWRFPSTGGSSQPGPTLPNPSATRADGRRDCVGLACLACPPLLTGRTMRSRWWVKPSPHVAQALPAQSLLAPAVHGDVARRCRAEWLPMPSGPAVAQAQAGQLRHQVKFRRPRIPDLDRVEANLPVGQGDMLGDHSSGCRCKNDNPEMAGAPSSATNRDSDGAALRRGGPRRQPGQPDLLGADRRTDVGTAAGYTAVRRNCSKGSRSCSQKMTTGL